MRRALLSISSLFVYFALSAQITVSTDIIPQVGDTLFSSNAVADQSLDLIGTGGPHAWDFSDLAEIDDQVRLVEALDLSTEDTAFAQADAKISFAEGSFNYYRILPDRMELIGTIGASDFLPDFTVTTPFSPAFIDRRAPLNLIDQFDNEANLTVALPVEDLPQELIDLAGPLLQLVDSVRFRTNIDQNDLVDAYGTLSVDGLDYEVLRERRTEIRDLRFDTYNELLGWQDATGLFVELIAGLPGGENFSSTDTVITYNFWDETGIVPAATIRTDAQGEITNVNYRTNRNETNSIDDDELRSATIRMFPNPAQQWVTFEADDLPRADYSLSIHNGLGQRMMTERFPKTDRIYYQVDLSHLPSGLYYYSLRNSRGRTLTTKRLLIGGYRP